MTEADYAWAAGLFEGEGCLTWLKRPGQYNYPTTTLSMTDEDVVRRFAAIIGIGKVTMRKLKPNRKQEWQWRAFGAAAMAHLDETIGPWLGSRRRAKLDEMLTFQPRREGLHGKWIGGRPRPGARVS